MRLTPVSVNTGSRCWISPSPAEKQWCYVIFQRSIDGACPVFFLGTLLAFQFVVSHAVRVSGNLEYYGMMDQSIKNGCCHGTVLKKFSTFGKGDIGCQDGRMHLVP